MTLNGKEPRHPRVVSDIRGSCAPIGAALLLLTVAARPVSAQDDRRTFVGALAGVSTLQADGRSLTTTTEAALSLYKPENGAAVNLLAGVHLAQYFAVQANWMWNRNDITLVSSITTPTGGGFYEQRRRSHQMMVDLDGLIYFRGLRSRLRPYLGTGLTVLRFSSDEIVTTSSNGLEAPASDIASTRIGLRSHVGIDVTLSRRASFRYSFSETISQNPISPSLTPPGERRLANFQNLFGIIARF